MLDRNTQSSRSCWWWVWESATWKWQKWQKHVYLHFWVNAKNVCYSEFIFFQLCYENQKEILPITYLGLPKSWPPPLNLVKNGFNPHPTKKWLKEFFFTKTFMSVFLWHTHEFEKKALRSPQSKIYLPWIVQKKLYNVPLKTR